MSPKIKAIFSDGTELIRIIDAKATMLQLSNLDRDKPFYDRDFDVTQGCKNEKMAMASNSCDFTFHFLLSKTGDSRTDRERYRKDCWGGTRLYRIHETKVTPDGTEKPHCLVCPDSLHSWPNNHRP